MAFNLKKVLKALLFSSSQPLAIPEIQAVFTRFHEQATLPVGSEPAMQETGVAGRPDETVEIDREPPGDAELYQEVPALVTTTQIREAMDDIATELQAANEGLLLIEGANGYRLVTHPQFARWVRILRADPPPLKLSQSSLETMAIVAYRQPVTRTEIESIRGVSAEAGINKLLERELIYIVGRADLPGRPIQYGTTDHFLEFVGIRSRDELPASDVLSSRQIDDWLQAAANPAKPPADAEMGLPLEEGEGSTPNLEKVSIEHPAAAGEPALPGDIKSS